MVDVAGNKGSEKLPLKSENQIEKTQISICTIASKNYLSYVRVLAKSFHRYNQGKVFLILTDRIEGAFDPSKEDFEVIEIESLKESIPNFDQFCFQYNTLELNTAVKPFILDHLLKEHNLDKIIFFDPDIMIYRPLEKISSLLDNNAIVITPHILEPYQDHHLPSEVEILKSGVYNLGFLALSKKKSTQVLLNWWKERLERYCKIDVEKGLFVDQRWIDLIPGFFDDVTILHDKTFNIAYWNFHDRNIEIKNEQYLIDGEPIHFMHFSGFNPEQVHDVSIHQDRFKVKDVSNLEPIFESYKKDLMNNGYEKARQWPCHFNQFKNGVKIPDVVRKIYWQMDPTEKESFGDPFEVNSRNSFFKWLNRKVDRGQPPLTRLMTEVYEKREDLHKIYPDIFEEDRIDFFNWFILSAKKELCLDDLFLKDLPKTLVSYPASRYVYLKNLTIQKIRSFAKRLLQIVFRNNLPLINRIKIIEKRITRRIGSFIRRLFLQRKLFLKKGINLYGYFKAELGVGEGVRSAAKCLQANGVKHVLMNNMTHSESRQDDDSFRLFSSKNPYAINLVHVNADMFFKFKEEVGRVFFKERYTIGYWVWELSDFPKEWEPSFSLCQEIWVPSRFVQEAIGKKAFVPIQKIPHAIGLEDFSPEMNRKRLNLSKKTFVFLYVFDFLSYFERKNPIAIVEAFKKTFSPEEDVALIMKCTNSSRNKKGFQELTQKSKGYPIQIMDECLTKGEVNSLMRLSDCYVSLHRSEGFGLTLAEAMSLGKPVIATNYSGNLEYMNTENSFLVNYRLKEIAQNIGPYKKDCVWADPDLEHASHLMRHVFQNQNQAKAVGKQAAKDIATNFSYESVGKQMKNRIETIFEANFNFPTLEKENES